MTPAHFFQFIWQEKTLVQERETIEEILILIFNPFGSSKPLINTRASETLHCQGILIPQYKLPYTLRCRVYIDALYRGQDGNWK